MKYTILMTAACLCLAVQSLHTQPVSKNMTLFDHVNPVDTLGEHSALWGYTAPNGREYACFGGPNGTYIYDITTKPIARCAFIPGPNSAWREMKTYKNYLYVVTESRDPGFGLQIIDLSNLPASASLIRTDTAIFLSAHTINIDKHYMYIMGTRNEVAANGGTVIYDLDPDPLHPVKLGAMTAYYHHDSYTRNDTLLGAAVYGQGCDIYDIRDKANPKKLNTITYPYSGTHNAVLTEDGRFVCTSDEISWTPKTLKVWDITNMNDITKVADYTNVPEDIIHNVHIKGRYAYVAWYTAGVRIIDMVDPTHPREVAYYDTYPGTSGDYEGVWEVYPYFASGKIIASDRNTGLYVFEFNANDAKAASVSGYVRDSSNSQPIPNATLEITYGIDGTKKIFTSDAAGRFYIPGQLGEYVGVKASKFEYNARITSFALTQDVQRDILLSRAPLENVIVVVRDSVTQTVLQEFKYALEPVYSNISVTDGQASLYLAHDSTFILTVGKWGYRTRSAAVKVMQDQQQDTIDLLPGYYDNASLDLGWQYQDPTDKATTGLWTRIHPYFGFAHAEWIEPGIEPYADPNGYIFITGAPVPNAPPQFNDVNGGMVTLTSPIMDLHNYNKPFLTLDLWYGYFPRDTVRDTMQLQVSNNDGTSWTTIYSDINVNKAGWNSRTFSLKDFTTVTNTMRIRLRASDTLANSLVLGAMDNFRITDGAYTGGTDRENTQRISAMLSVHPNPTSGDAVVRVDVGSPFRATIAIFDPLGRNIGTLYNGILATGTNRFSIGKDLPSGMYYIRITDEHGATASTRLSIVR